MYGENHFALNRCEKYKLKKSPGAEAGFETKLSCQTGKDWT
jgi:hypothetical protein